MGTSSATVPMKHTSVSATTITSQWESSSTKDLTELGNEQREFTPSDSSLQKIQFLMEGNSQKFRGRKQDCLEYLVLVSREYLGVGICQSLRMMKLLNDGLIGLFHGIAELFHL